MFLQKTPYLFRNHPSFRANARASNGGARSDVVTEQHRRARASASYGTTACGRRSGGRKKRVVTESISRTREGRKLEEEGERGAMKEQRPGKPPWQARKQTPTSRLTLMRLPLYLDLEDGKVGHAAAKEEEEGRRPRRRCRRKPSDSSNLPLLAHAPFPNRLNRLWPRCQSTAAQLRQPRAARSTREKKEEQSQLTQPHRNN